MEQTVWNGKRWSAADAYLKPALKRPNLEVYKCLARRIVRYTIPVERDSELWIAWTHARTVIGLADPDVILGLFRQARRVRRVDGGTGARITVEELGRQGRGAARRSRRLPLLPREGPLDARTLRRGGWTHRSRGLCRK